MDCGFDSILEFRLVGVESKQCLSNPYHDKTG